MGFVKIAHVDTVEEAREIWSSFLDLSERNREQRVCKVPEKIENGSRIFLADSQSFVLFAGDKFVDTVSGPGIFVYLDVFAGREQFGYMKQHNEIFMGMKPEAFADGPLDEAMEGFLIARQEAKPMTFTFDEATYHDFGRKMDVVLQGSGYFILRQANLLSNYALADFCREKLLERTLPEFSEEEKKQLALDVENAFEKTLGGLSETHLSYEFLPHLSNVVTAFVNEQLYEKWVLGKGIILKTIEFKTFYPAEQCIPALVQFEKARKAERERAQAARAQEEAKAAAQAQQQAGQAQRQTWQTQQIQQSAGNQQVTSQANQTSWQQNAASQQTAQYQQNAAARQLGEGCYVIRTGSCCWAKGGLNLLQGKATLTNREFSFSSMKFGQMGMVVLNKFTENGSEFVVPLSEVVEVVEAKQGLAKALEFHLNNGQSYKCSFRDFMKDTTDEWLVTIRSAVSNYKG